MRHVWTETVKRWRATLRVIILAVVLVPGVHAGELQGIVVGVIDGDTVDVLDGDKTVTRVRLSGIDAPEKAMPYGQKSKQYLSDLVYKKTVQVVAEKRDRYGRTVGKIIFDGLDINLMMVRDGLAWHYKQYSREQSIADQALYADAEVQAKREGLGLWATPNPVPPWDWRNPPR